MVLKTKAWDIVGHPSLPFDFLPVDENEGCEIPMIEVEHDHHST